MRLLCLTLGAVLAATACTGADDATTTMPDAPQPAPGSPAPGDATDATDPGGPSPTDAEGDASAPSSTRPTSRSGDDAAAPPLAATCRLDAGSTHVGSIRLAHPQGWKVDRCGFFDPQRTELAEGTEAQVAVRWDVEDVAFGRLDEPAEGEATRHLTTLAGRRAIRTAGETTDGLGPPGRPYTRWLLDLDVGDDDRGGVLVGSVRGEPASVARATAVDVLDRMAQALRAGEPAEDLGGGVRAVALRSEDGEVPYTVSLEHGCLVAHAGGLEGDVVDEACDLSFDVGSPADLHWLDVGTDQRVLAGLVEGRVARLDVVGDAPGVTGYLPVSIEGGGVFATVPSPADLRLDAYGHDGEHLGTIDAPR